MLLRRWNTIKNTKGSWVWQLTPVIPAPWETVSGLKQLHCMVREMEPLKVEFEGWGGLSVKRLEDKEEKRSRSGRTGNPARFCSMHLGEPNPCTCPKRTQLLHLCRTGHLGSRRRCSEGMCACQEPTHQLAGGVHSLKCRGPAGLPYEA